MASYMQCPECKLTVPATATYLSGDTCPRCLTTMLPRDRFRDAAPIVGAAMRQDPLAAPPA
jgi:Zn-finger nucleic acid-binding protein